MQKVQKLHLQLCRCGSNTRPEPPPEIVNKSRLDSALTPNSHQVRQHTRIPRSQCTKMGLIHVHGCVHTDIRVHHYDRRWVPTPNMRWCMVRNVIKTVRDALVHAVWPRGYGSWRSQVSKYQRTRSLQPRRWSRASFRTQVAILYSKLQIWRPL